MNETLADTAAGFLLGRIDYERTPPKSGTTSTFRLERMEELLRRLGDPQRQIRCVHIAGSKGKGSTAAMTASILTAAGHRTGLFTSPHIVRFEERIRVDGEMIPTARCTDLVDRLRPIVAEMDTGPLGGPTFFELTTALAWLHFLQESVDIAVMEVGLGGRLDATNICRPEVTLITSISRDHTRLLGETLSEIAAEKAGILKPNVTLLSAVTDAEARTAIQAQVDRVGIETHWLGDEIQVEFAELAPQTDDCPTLRWTFSCRTRWRTHSDLVSPLPGRHQAINASLAVTAADYLNGNTSWRIGRKDIRHGLESVHWPLRTEILARGPLLIVDAAHNEASIAALIDTLQETNASGRIAIFAASRDKDAAAMLRQIIAAFDDVVLTRFVGNPRAVTVEDLQTLAGDDPAATIHPAQSPEEALALARWIARHDDLICATGSFFLAAEVRQLHLADSTSVDD